MENMPTDLDKNCFFCGEINECIENNHSETTINTLLLNNNFSIKQIETWWNTPSGSYATFGFSPLHVWKAAGTGSKRLKNRVALYARLTLEKGF